MTTNMKTAQNVVFGHGVDGIGAQNFKLFPGSARESSSEDVAAQISAAIAEIASGEAEQLEY